MDLQQFYKMNFLFFFIKEYILAPPPQPLQNKREKLLYSSHVLYMCCTCKWFIIYLGADIKFRRSGNSGVFWGPNRGTAVAGRDLLSISHASGLAEKGNLQKVINLHVIEKLLLIGMIIFNSLLWTIILVFDCTSNLLVIEYQLEYVCEF